MPQRTDSPRARLPFAFVDVFTDTPLAGNPLPVVPDADGVDDDTLRELAREFNQVETTFVLMPTQTGADWRLRSFTATGTEVSGAGHNALGAWWWLADSGRLSLTGQRSTFTQELGGRLLPVDVMTRDGRVAAVEMTQTPPAFGTEVTDLNALAAALRVPVDHFVTTPLVPQVVSTGASHLLVPVTTREAVNSAVPDPDCLTSLLRAAGGQGCYVFALDPISPGATAYARFFSPAVGIAEDVATGSAAGPLACYLVARNIVPDSTPVIVEQGHALKRPSRIEVIVRGPEVRLIGHGCVTAEGTIRVRSASDRSDPAFRRRVSSGTVASSRASGPVAELRVALTATDFDTLRSFYCDGLGLEPAPLWTIADEGAVLLKLGRATLEIFDEAHAAVVDQIEAGRRVSGPIRFALEVPDVDGAVARLIARGATLVRGPFVTPWRHRNARLEAPDGLQITLFQVLKRRFVKWY
jgi:trans-2,3-dihydro-3-hydroxyanthranilate isomerase